MRIHGSQLTTSSLLLLAFANVACGYGIDENRRVNHGLIGFGIPFLEPSCAFACRYNLYGNRLACSTATANDAEWETSTDCRAGNEPYLLSLAACLQEYCNGTEIWTLERFWAEDAASDTRKQREPELSYGSSLNRLGVVLNSSWSKAEVHGSLLSPQRVAFADWHVAITSLQDDAYVERHHARAGIILILTVVLLPFILAFWRVLPLPRALRRNLVAHFGHSALFGRRHAVPFPRDLGIIPTRGQAIFISTLIVLNLVLLFTGYHASEPNTHNVSAGRRMRGYVANRAGNLAFANFSIMVLCSSRNNLFVRLTKFSYSTMLLFHRWSAYLCTAHASVHTVIYIINHINLLPKKFGQAYWNWGVGAATLMLLILPLSTLPVRKRAYELFLAGHNMMAAGVFIACYYHIYMNYQHEYGYENWIYLPAVLWILDRGLRLMRLARNGIRTATVTRLDHDYLRVDIPRVDVQGHVFLYFPTLRIWQTHPFSVAASLVEVSIEYKMDTLRRSSVDEELAAAASEWHTLAVDDSDDDEEEEEEEEEEDASDEGATTKNEKGSRMPLVSRQASQNLDNRAAENEKQEPDEDNDESSLLPTPRHTNPSSHPPSPAQTTTTIPGATFYIRRHSGITALLFRQNLRSLPVLLEGPYSPHRHIPSTTHLLCIAGGVGITGALPAFTSHAGVLIASGTRIASSSSLYWSCRSPALVQDVEGKFLGLLQSAASAAVGADGSRPVEVRVKTEGRWDVDRIVHDRARSLLERDGGDVVVLVCGPPGMADAVRRAVVRVNLGVGKTKLNDKGGSAVGRVRLIEEGFWW